MPEIKKEMSIISLVRELFSAKSKVITSQICRASCTFASFIFGIKEALASSGAELANEHTWGSFADLGVRAAREECAGGAAREECAKFGVARGECATGAAREECAVLGVARVDDLMVIAEKQRKIMVRRDAKSGVRNALASSGAEIQGEFELSNRNSEKNAMEQNLNKEGEEINTLCFLAARATARFCWFTMCWRRPGSEGCRGGRGRIVLF